MDNQQAGAASAPAEKPSKGKPEIKNLTPEEAKKHRAGFHLTIMTESDTLFDEEVKAITSYNEDGKFDVLPMHANFISLVREKVIVHKPDDSKQEFPLEVAVLKVGDNDVEVFFGIEGVDLDIDRKKLIEQHKKAREQRDGMDTLKVNGKGLN